MALYRTALRLATLEALRPTAVLAANGPWPTLAGKRVFDSRIDPIEDLTPDQHKAAIVVYTDFDEGYAAQKRGGPPFRRIVDLVLELSQICSEPSAADPAVYDAGVPQTDAELEAELDRLETEISLALLYAPTGSIWRRLTGRLVTDPRSTPHRTSEEGVRLAMRTVIWKVQVPDDLFDAAPSIEPVGLARLPEPLQTVIGELAATAYGARLGAGLAATMPTMPVATPLKTVVIDAEMVPDGVTPSGDANNANMHAEVDDLDQE